MIWSCPSLLPMLPRSLYVFPFSTPSGLPLFLKDSRFYRQGSYVGIVLLGCCVSDCVYELAPSHSSSFRSNISPERPSLTISSSYSRWSSQHLLNLSFIICLFSILLTTGGTLYCDSMPPPRFHTRIKPNTLRHLCVNYWLSYIP